MGITYEYIILNASFTSISMRSHFAFAFLNFPCVKVPTPILIMKRTLLILQPQTSTLTYKVSLSDVTAAQCSRSSGLLCLNIMLAVFGNGALFVATTASSRYFLFDCPNKQQWQLYIKSQHLASLRCNLHPSHTFPRRFTSKTHSLPICILARALLHNNTRFTVY